MIVLYLGPNNVMPLASILAAIVGFILIFWRLILKAIRNFFHTILRRNQTTSQQDESVAAEHEPKR